MYTKLTVELPGRQGPEIIVLEEIISIQSVNDKISIILVNQQEKKANLSIGMAEILFNYPFLIKCHRNYIVNIFKVKEELPDRQSIRMADNTIIPLSESYKYRLHQAIKIYRKDFEMQAVGA
jgi:DNA-binding LytR/AlgR family response regulator